MSESTNPMHDVELMVRVFGQREAAKLRIDEAFGVAAIIGTMIGDECFFFGIDVAAGQPDIPLSNAHEYQYEITGGISIPVLTSKVHRMILPDLLNTLNGRRIAVAVIDDVGDVELRLPTHVSHKGLVPSS